MKAQDLNILFEDNHLLIIEKPINMLVQEDASGDIDLLNLAKQFLVKKYNKPGDAFLGLVHRLDRPVGGVILFAKTSKGASRISNEIRKNKFKRSYLAIINGKPKHTKKRLTDYLIKNKKTNTSYVTNSKDKKGKKSILDYELINYDEQNDLSLVHIELQTGRSHQIRVQFSNIGHPIYGDQRYGKQFSKPGQQIALWAHTIEVKHPTQDKNIYSSVNPPTTSPWSLFNNSY